MVTIFFYRRIVSKLKALQVASDVSTIHPTSRRNNGLVSETRLSTPFNKILATPLQDLCARLLGMATLRILLLTFTSRFVIDFLSIGKVIIFSAIATDDRHPLRSRSIHQNAANCKTIRFRYIAQPRGVRKTYCARSRNDVRRLTSRSNAMPSKKTMESLEDVRSCRNCSKARPNVSK